MRNPFVRSAHSSRLTARLIAIVSFAALLYGPSPALAQPPLGAADSFGALTSTAVTCTDSFITGNVGVDDPLGVVTQTNCTITGGVFVGTAPAPQAYTDFLAAYDALAAETCDVTLVTLAGQTLQPDTVYCVAAAATETGTLTLNGNSTDTFIIKIGTGGTGALTGTNFSVVMTSGEVCSNNVYWWIADAVTLTDSNFVGRILAGDDITVTRGTVRGQALANGADNPTGAVTLTNTSILCNLTQPPIPPEVCEEEEEEEDDDDDDHDDDDHKKDKKKDDKKKDDKKKDDKKKHR